MQTKQTAIEWLEDNLNFEPYDEEEFISNNKIWEQAKQMEREQIEKAFQHSIVAILVGKILSPAEYYNETYIKQ